MLTAFARLLLTATSIAPVAVIYGYVSIFQGNNVVGFVAFALAATLLVLCLGLLHHVRENSEILRFEATSVEPADAETVGFMLLYLLPLFTDRIEVLNWELWIPLLFVFAVVVATGYGYHFNPLLGLFGWHFYKVTAEDGVSYVLITKKHLRRASGVHKIGQLTEYILIDLDS